MNLRFLKYFFALSEKPQELLFHYFASPKAYALSFPRLQKFLTKTPCYTGEKGNTLDSLYVTHIK